MTNTKDTQTKTKPKIPIDAVLMPFLLNDLKPLNRKKYTVLICLLYFYTADYNEAFQNSKNENINIGEILL